ncbi:MAG: VWA domain-containing protein [Gammaproteobacteria bacterium]|nr:VWA domain-containing protein [Gammaproteobacteria bacterium]
MNKVLYVFIDSSGSMAEMGKILLQRNLCRFISQLPSINNKYLKLDIDFYNWNSSITAFNLQSNGDIPEIIPQETVDLNTLASFLYDLSTKDQQKDIYVLLLTDGGFESGSISKFNRKVNKFSNLKLQVVAVGADANIFNLEKILPNQKVYLAEDISGAVYSLIFDHSNDGVAPVSIHDLKTSKTEVVEDDWDA